MSDLRRRALVAGVTGLAAVAAIVVVWRATRPEPIVLAQAEKRAIEARLSDARVDRWRPYDGARAAGSAGEEVRVDVLAALEKRGDWRGLGDAYLLAGEPARAEAALAKAGASADVESDRAALALALARRDGKAALGHATRALGLAPGHRQATWNRALALVELGLTRTAASAFEAIAARGEPGWGAEAKARAKVLRDRQRTAEAQRQAADVAGREMAKSGLQPAPELVRAYPQLIVYYLYASMDQLEPKQLVALVPVAEAADPDGKYGLVRQLRGAPKSLPHDPPDLLLALRLMLEQTTTELHAGRAADAEERALAGFAAARRAGFDPRDLPRRFLVLLAEAARAAGDPALSDAAVDEARLYL